MSERRGGPMRILMFMPGLRPDSLGLAVHQDFAAAVREQGHSFEILTTAEADRFTGEPGTLLTAHPTGVARWLGRRSAALRRTPNVEPWASALARFLAVRGHDFDVLHVEVAYPHGAAALRGARQAGFSGPIAVTPMGEDVLLLREAHYGFRRHLGPRLAVRKVLRASAAVRCISAIALAAVRELAPTARCEVIPLNVTAETVRASAREPAARDAERRAARAALAAELGLGDAPLVLALGRLHPFKGIPVLVEAMARVRTDARLVIAGPSLRGKAFGDHATAIVDRAHAIGLAERVRWIGAVEPSRALALLAAADLLVVPSVLESLNKVCVEAAAAGTPFIVTSTTGIAELVPRLGVGVVVPSGDFATMAATIDEVLGGRFTVDAAAQRAFVERFAPERIASEVLRFYAESVAR